MITFPAVDSASSIVVDTNVVINLLSSDPTGSSLNLLTVNGTTTYITDTVEAELQNNLSGAQFAVYLNWANSQHAAGEVVLVATGIPADRNQGEASMLWAVENGFAGDGPHLMLSGDSDARDSFGGLDTANTMEFADSLLLSGEITLARYYALSAQIASVTPHEVIGVDGANFAFVPGFRGTVNGVEVFVGTHGLTVNGQNVGLLQTFEIDPQTGIVAIDGPENCFGPEVAIDMWPLGPEFAPNPNNPYKQFDQEAVRTKIWKKPIELIRVGDYVVSYDKDGNMVPGYVPRTFQNNAKIVLNFHGTCVTPGHVYYRPDSKRADKYETLIDVLRDDGMIEYRDGIKRRAATNIPVGDPRDGFVQAVARKRRSDGTFEQSDAGRIRLGTRFLVGEGRECKSFAVADLIEADGGVVGEDELIYVGDSEPMQFLWEFSDMLPNPEDFVLACSGTTLEDIYRAAEWEDRGPRLPAPMMLDGGAVRPLNGVARSAMSRNEPLAVEFDGRPTLQNSGNNDGPERIATQAGGRVQ